ncbi:MAG TPA: (2Fe-2S)-binding protein [Oscillospiraceae bacterium]|nr:(2Fe-2S)-binding protein [Oscillospiraceae bacterium]
MVKYEGKAVIKLHVNGEEHELAVRTSDILLDVLRQQIGLTGAKAGCLNGDCGACTIIVDGLPAKSCLMLAVEAENHEILTVEGLNETDKIQKFFVDSDAFQCGYCTSGFLMVCHSLKLENPIKPDEIVIEEWLQSNICRCTSYKEIGRAVDLMYQSE